VLSRDSRQILSFWSKHFGFSILRFFAKQNIEYIIIEKQKPGSHTMA